MSKNHNNKPIDDSAYEVLLAEEELILHAQMMIQGVLNDTGISQKALAERMGVGESYVSQMLGLSARNLTLRTIARVMHALDVKATIVLDDHVEARAPAVAISTAGDEDQAKAVASKIAAARYSSVWGEVVALPPRKKAKRRHNDAEAFASFAPSIRAFEPDVMDIPIAA